MPELVRGSDDLNSMAVGILKLASFSRKLINSRAFAFPPPLSTTKAFGRLTEFLMEHTPYRSFGHSRMHVQEWPASNGELRE